MDRTALCSTAYVEWDQFRGNPEPLVMKWGFILVTLYMGPIGLAHVRAADQGATIQAPTRNLRPRSQSREWEARSTVLPVMPPVSSLRPS